MLDSPACGLLAKGGPRGRGRSGGPYAFRPGRGGRVRRPASPTENGLSAKPSECICRDALRRNGCAACTGAAARLPAGGDVDEYGNSLLRQTTPAFVRSVFGGDAFY